MKKQLSKGFTLIELLVVIAVVGILAAAVMVGINPADKLALANDSKARNDIGAIAGAAVSYSTTHDASYTLTVAELSSATIGELKTNPVAPSGYTYTYTATTNAGGVCTTAAKDCTKFVLYTDLKAAKESAAPRLVYDSSNGKTCTIATSVTPIACP